MLIIDVNQVATNKSIISRFIRWTRRDVLWGVLLLIIALLSTYGLIALSKQHKQNETRLSQYDEARKSLDELKERNEVLLTEQEVLNERVKALTDQVLLNSDDEPIIMELTRVRVAAGLTDITGNGVRITLSDSENDEESLSLIHSQDVVYYVDLLKALHAECISVNGERVVTNTAIVCLGPTIRVNEKRISSPFIIEAIGDADLMVEQLLNDERLSLRESQHVSIIIEKVDECTIPAYSDDSAYRNFLDSIGGNE